VCLDTRVCMCVCVRACVDYLAHQQDLGTHAEQLLHGAHMHAHMQHSSPTPTLSTAFPHVTLNIACSSPYHPGSLPAHQPDCTAILKHFSRPLRHRLIESLDTATYPPMPS
jgi:hypothetical protein